MSLLLQKFFFGIISFATLIIFIVVFSLYAPTVNASTYTFVEQGQPSPNLSVCQILGGCSDLETPSTCWNSESPGVTDCGQPCFLNGQGRGDAWSRYTYSGCKQLTPVTCTAQYDWATDVCSTADKCDGPTGTTGNGNTIGPYLKAGSCNCQIGNTYKTCCTNASPSLVAGNSCVQISNDNIDPPWEGICPSGTHTQFCGFGGYPACGQSACGPTTICGNGVCESGETSTTCPADCAPTPTSSPGTTPTPTPSPGSSCNCTYPQACTTDNNEAGVQTCSGIVSGLNCVYDNSGSCAANCSTCVVNPPEPPLPPPPTGCSYGACGPCPAGAHNYTCSDPNKCRYVQGPSCASDNPAWFVGAGCYQDNNPNSCGGTITPPGQERCAECTARHYDTQSTIFMTESVSNLTRNYCVSDRVFQWQGYGPRADTFRQAYNDCLWDGGTQESCSSDPRGDASLYSVDHCICGGDTSEVSVQSDPDPIAGTPFTVTASSFKPFDLESNCWAYGRFYDADSGNLNDGANPSNPPGSGCGTPKDTQFARDVYLIYTTSSNPQGFVSLGKAQDAFNTSQTNKGVDGIDRTYPRRVWTWLTTLPEGTYTLYTYVVNKDAPGQFLGNPTQSWQCGQLGSSLVVHPNSTPWLQTTNGDVHSNAQISASGGPQTAAGASCEAPTNICRAQGLVSASTIANNSKFYTSSTGASAISDRTQFAPYRIPTYDDLKAIYFDKSKSTKNSITGSTLPNNFGPADGLYKSSGDISITGNTNGAGTQIIFVEGKLNINKDITFHTNDNNGGLVFVVKSDVVIDPTVKQIDAVIISGGKIYTAGDNCTTNTVSVPTSSALTINGELISLNQIDATPIKFCRVLTNNNPAAEKINHQSKYLVILRNLFADTFQKWSEVP